MQTNRFNVVFFFLFCFTCSLASQGQQKESSPYSAFGLGELNKDGNILTMGMGGVSYALQRNNFVNASNPASYAGIDSMSFVFDIGFHLALINQKTSNSRLSFFSGNLSYLSLSFPLTKWWATAAGLTAEAQRKYRFEEKGTQPEILGHRNYVYEGSGGLNNFYWGHSFRIFQNFTVGVNMEYLFGNYLQSSAVLFHDTLPFFNSAIEEHIRVSDVNFKFGVQYFYPLSEKQQVGIGIVYTPQTRLGATKKRSAYTFTEQGGIRRIRDSVYRSEDNKQSIVRPQVLGLGFSFEEQDKLFVGLDMTYDQGSKFEFLGEKVEEMRDNVSFALGGEWIPDFYGNYLSKITYRAGLFYDQGSLAFDNHRISEMGLSFGLGLPIRRSKSLINLSFSYVHKGSSKANLIQEDMFKIGLSLSSRDRWFVKRKYK